MITWRQVAEHYPELVQFAAQKFGPLPEECTKEDYDRAVHAIQAETDADPGGAEGAE
jgi:hypothetical protein